MKQDRHSPKATRLRYVCSKDPDALTSFLQKFGERVEIKGAPVYAKSKWWLWYIVGDNDGRTVINKDLDE